MSDGWIAGVFSVSVDMSANAAAGIPIVASAFSNQMDVVKAGINNTLTKDGQNVPTSVLPMGGYRHTGTGKAQAATDYQRVNEFIYMSPIYMVDSDTGSTTISLSTAYFPSLSAGMRVIVKMPAQAKPDGAGANVVVRINGGSANCSAADGTQLWPGAFAASGVHEIQRDSTSFKLLNPSYKVVSQALASKARTAGGVSVTASAAAPDVSCEMWRDENTATVHMAPGGYGTRVSYHWETSTGTTIFLSALPPWLRPTVARYHTHRIFASTSTPRTAEIHVSTDGRIVIENIEGNNDVDCGLLPFAITYPVK